MYSSLHRKHVWTHLNMIEYVLSDSSENNINVETEFDTHWCLPVRKIFLSKKLFANTAIRFS